MILRSAAIVVLACIAAAGHSLIKPKFPIILSSDSPAKATVTAATTTVAPQVTPPAQGSQAATSGATAPVESVNTTPAAAEAHAGSSINVSIAQAFEFFQQGKPFIDSRHLPEYREGHVENAFQLAADELLKGMGADWINALDKNDIVIIYCGGGDCDASHNLMNYLTQSFNFTQCRIMHDGWPAWKAAGHPGATGDPLIGN